MNVDEIVCATSAYRSELCRQVQDDSGIDSALLEKDL